MNTKTGKLLVLGGFGLKLIPNIIGLLYSFISMSTAALSISNAFYILGMLTVAVGFAIIFMNDHNILDLVIAGGFAVSSIAPTILLSLLNSGIMWEIVGSNSLELVNGLNILLDLFTTAIMLLWAFKLFKDSKMIAAIAVAGSIALGFIGGFFVSFFGISLETLAHLAYVAAAAALVFAAFLDFAEDK